MLSSIRELAISWVAYDDERSLATISQAPTGLGTRQRQLDPPVLCPPLRGIVRGNWVRVAKPPRRDKVRIQALRDQILHDGVGALLRQNLVRGDALALQFRTDRGVIRIAGHQDFVLLCRRQL